MNKVKVPVSVKARNTSNNRGLSLKTQRKLFDGLSEGEHDKLGELMFSIGVEYDSSSIVRFKELLYFFNDCNRWRRVIPSVQNDTLCILELYLKCDSISREDHNYLLSWKDGK